MGGPTSSECQPNGRADTIVQESADRNGLSRPDASDDRPDASAWPDGMHATVSIWIDDRSRRTASRSLSHGPSGALTIRGAKYVSLVPADAHVETST